ncbi:hypothetical protein [Cerasicoccus maritimus]|uniref:hypothetical protein n=1 Tax=Cerasicoccus maritimus TaxID=490089 RepID=UPI0028526F15|nr:hypothetical protein [Cerasicoccus maritimus]
MATRGLIGFRLNEADKLAYNHYDSNPEHLGSRIWEEVREVDPDAWDIVRERARSLVTISEQRQLGPNDGMVIAEMRRHLPEVKYDRQPRDYYDLFKPVQGTLRPYLNGKLTFMADGSDFIYDSLHCEWAYIVNLDAHAFEVWRGKQLNPSEEGAKRYDMGPDRMGYYPCALLKSYRLNELPDKRTFRKDTTLPKFP